MSWNDVAGFLGACLIIAYFGVVIFLITLLWRITLALDVKRIARATDSKQSGAGDEPES